MTHTHTHTHTHRICGIKNICRLFFVFLIFALSACSEKERTIPYNVSKTAVSTCNNGILDSGEIDIDCGGICKECETIDLPCNPSSNTALIKSFPEVSFTNTTYVTQLGKEYSNDSWYGTINILLGSVPSSDKIFTINNEADVLKATEAKLKLEMGSYLVSTCEAVYGESLYCKVNNDTISFTFCGMEFNTPYGTQLGTGNLTVINKK